MDVLEWAIDPRGHRVPIHIAWFLIQVAFVSAVAFLIVHAAYIRFFAGEKQWSGTTAPEVVAAIPERVPRHSLVARAFHWLMAASMLTLLFTAFLPKVGVEFDFRRGCARPLFLPGEESDVGGVNDQKRDRRDEGHLDQEPRDVDGNAVTPGIYCPL